MYQYKDPTDGFIFRRFEYFSIGSDSDDGIPTKINITNRNGIFDSTQDGKSSHAKSTDLFHIVEDLPSDLNYSIENTADGIIYSMVPSSAKAGAIRLRVGQDEPFIYEFHFSSGNGSQGWVFNKADFNASITPALFDETKHSDSLSEILKKALEQASQINFTATADFNGDKYIYYQQYNPDQNFVCQREDFFFPKDSKKPVGIDLIIPEGVFGSTKNLSIKRNDMSGKRFFAWPADNVLTSTISITAKDINFEGIKCWSFTVDYANKVKDDGMAFNKAVYIVGKDNYFIYAWRYFSEAGKEIRNIVLRDVKINPQFPVGCFDIPSGKKIETNNNQEYRNAINNMSGLGKRAPMKWLYKVLIALSALLVVVIVIKIFRRNK